MKNFKEIISEVKKFNKQKWIDFTPEERIEWAKKYEQQRKTFPYSDMLYELGTRIRANEYVTMHKEYEGEIIGYDVNEPKPYVLHTGSYLSYFDLKSISKSGAMELRKGRKTKKQILQGK